MENMRLNMLKEMLKGLSDNEKLELFKEASNLDLTLDTEEKTSSTDYIWDGPVIDLEGLNPDKEFSQVSNIYWSDIETSKPEGLDPDKKDSQESNIDWSDLATIEPESPSAFVGIPIPDEPPSSIMGFGSPRIRERQRTESPIWTEENYLFGSNTRLMNIANEIYNTSQYLGRITKRSEDLRVPYRNISGRKFKFIQNSKLNMGITDPEDLFALRFLTKGLELSETLNLGPLHVPLSDLSIKRNVLDFSNFEYRREGNPPVKEIILEFEDSSNPNTTIEEFLKALNYMDFYHKALSLDMRHIEALINKSKNNRTDNKKAILNDRSLLLLDPSFKLETDVDIFRRNLYVEGRGEVHQHHLLFSGESETKDISRLMKSYREKRKRLDRAYSIYRERGTITLIHSLLPYEGYLEVEGNKVKVSPRFYEDYRSRDFKNDLYRKFVAKLEDNGNFILS